MFSRIDSYQALTTSENFISVTSNNSLRRVIAFIITYNYKFQLYSYRSDLFSDND